MDLSLLTIEEKHYFRELERSLKINFKIQADIKYITSIPKLTTDLLTFMIKY